jgi:hypothetical protein
LGTAGTTDWRSPHEDVTITRSPRVEDVSSAAPEFKAGSRESTRGLTREMPALVGVALFAAALNVHYGPRGFMPLDHSVVFDGGWRILDGQVPFRDFTTPNALTPSFLQAGFFLAFGVTWKAYVLHATIFNALFAVLVYVLLRLSGGSLLTAAFYAGLSGIVFYPPLGVPFHDQHAFFFMLLAITLAVSARRVHGPRAQLVLWALVPFALGAAALSKQTPVLLGTPIVLALALVGAPSVGRAFAGLAAGSAASVAIIAAAGFVGDVDWELVWVYLVELPLATGGARGGRADSTAMSLFLLSGLFLVVVVGPSVLVNRARGRPQRLAPGVGLPLALSAALMLMCAAFASLTLNEPTEGIPLFFASLGLFHIAVVRALPSWPLVGRVSLASAAGVIVAIVSLAAGWSYNSSVNERRSASNLIYTEASVERGLPSALATMRFQVPERYEGLRAADIGRVVAHLTSEPGSFLLIGDTTILNGISDKPSVFPALFLSVGLTIPERGTPELERFEQRIFENLARYDVRRVVLERRTWEGTSLADLPRLQEMIERCKGETRTFGFFRVIELADRDGCSPSYARAA